jgi:hypothetical protein
VAGANHVVPLAQVPDLGGKGRSSRRDGMPPPQREEPLGGRQRRGYQPFAKREQVGQGVEAPSGRDHRVRPTNHANVAWPEKPAVLGKSACIITRVFTGRDDFLMRLSLYSSSIRYGESRALTACGETAPHG